MQDLLENTSLGSAEIAATCMALQHILVKKGICSFEELTAANKRAQEMVGSLGSMLSSEQPKTAEIISSVKEMVTFIGGEATPILLHKTLDQLQDLFSKENSK